MLILSCSGVKLTDCYCYKDPTTKKEEKKGTISLNVLVALNAGQRVWITWKGENSAYLYSEGDKKSIHFTGEKL